MSKAKDENLDLITIEFVKEARILKRQLQLMKENTDKISKDNLIKICSIIKLITHEINELEKASSEVI